MTEKEDVAIVAFKTVSGEDVLGLYSGEITLDYSNEQAMMIYRPIKIELISTYHVDGISTNYYPKFYFPFGEAITPIPYRTISHQELANPFFTRMYKKFLVELIDYEEKRQERITKVFDDRELESILNKTHSMFMDLKQNFQQ